MQKLLIIDGHSYIFRAFYGVRSALTNAKGQATNALFGFKNMLRYLLKSEDFSHIVMVFDHAGGNFRHELFPDYKANRDQAPDDLKSQIPLIFQIVELLNIPIISLPDYEADDVIGSLVYRFQEQIPLLIISGDKDLTQLVTEEVQMFDTMKDKLYTPAEVVEKFGLPPVQIHEYLSLVGDASDNIPGAKGIGPKTAVNLLQEYGSIQKIYENLSQIKGSVQKKLADAKEMVALSQQLTKIKCDLPLTHVLSDLERQPPQLEALAEFYHAMNFKPDELLQSGLTSSPQRLVSETISSVLERERYQLVTDQQELIEIRAQILKCKEFALDFETSSLQAVEAEIVGIALCWEGAAPVYIPVAHAEEPTTQLSLPEVLKILQPLLQSPDITMIAQNVKYEIMVMANYGLFCTCCLEDTMLQSYLLGNQRHNLDYLAATYLNHQMITYQETAGKGKSEIPFAQVPLQQALKYAAEDAEATFLIHQKLLPKLKEQQQENLYYELEIPVAKVLARMEHKGVKINPDYLQELSIIFHQEQKILADQIYRIAGEKFNLNSPKQLGVILFEKLGIKTGLKKTKTGYSTDAAVLQKIAYTEKIGALLLSYRGKTKLINTYTDVLPNLMVKKTGRLHTSYQQTVTATGRLSSTNPNLQNIPIRGIDGEKIRKAFIAAPNCVLLSADYSQIELRFLAHFSEDPYLSKAFCEHQDIHTETASALFKMPIEFITSEQRQIAKAINFGIIYGMSAYRLSQEIGMPHFQAKEFIATYFQRYAKIQVYIEKTIEKTRQQGFIETILGRRRWIPDIISQNHLARSAAERIAVNTSIQGSAADMIKKAMIAVDQTIIEQNLNSRLIMQVHDELILEVPENELDLIQTIVKDRMEKALLLSVPMIVNLKYGNNWLEAHG